MFEVDTTRSGFLSDTVILRANQNGAITKRWLGWDRLGASSLKSELWQVTRGEKIKLRVRRGSLMPGQVLSAADIDGMDTSSLRKMRS